MNDQAPEEEMQTPEQTPQPPQESPSQQDSRMKAFLRRSLRWATAVAVIFFLGFALLYFGRVRPQAAQLREQSDTIATLQAQVSPLQTQAANLGDVQTELAQTQLQRDLLSVLADVNTARLALGQDNGAQASVALQNTSDTLSMLADQLGGSQTSALADMSARLELAKQEIQNGDRFAAQSDLEVLANSTLQLLDTLP